MGRVAWLGLVALAACFAKPDPPPSDGSVPPTSFSALVAGSEHACAIDGSGRLFCWGNNDYGRLGVATTMRYSASPLQVEGTWTEVAAGNSHTCALDNMHQIWCWGRSDMGQAGVIAMSIDKTQVVLPDANSVPAHIYAGGDMSCATDQYGHLSCWGDYDPSSSAPHDPTHIQPGGGVGNTQDNWFDVALAPYHACALDDLSRAWCWGLNANLQVGDPSGTAHGIPDAFQITGGIFTSIAAAEYASCGITPAKQVACWGVALVTTGSGTSSGFTVVGSDKDWADVVVGGSHACALHDNGNLDCWGRNDTGELGNDYAPKAAPGTTTLQHVALAAAGAEFTCAQDDQAIRCWGSDQYGQTGRGNSATVRVPAQVLLPEKATQVAAGQAHTCAVGVSGKVYCWGHNKSGQVATGAGEFVVMPTNTTHVTNLDPDRKLISLGYEHTCARNSTTQLDCWGQNSSGQLGPSATGVSTNDTDLTATFDDFSAGGFSSCVTTSKGQLYCWGSLEGSTTPTLVGNYGTVALTYEHGIAAVPPTTNNVAQLGSQAFCTTTVGSDIVPDSGTAKQRKVFMGVGSAFGCVLESTTSITTTLVCVGDNDSHQITQNSTTCVSPPTSFSSLGDAKISLPGGARVMWHDAGRPTTVALGGDHMCAIEETPNNVGTLYCWGANFESQLGDLNAASDVVNAPHAATAGTWFEVTTSAYFTCALTDMIGDVYCWGLNQFGEVGNNDRFPSLARGATPVQF